MKTNKYLADHTHEVELSGIRIMFALADEISDNERISFYLTAAIQA